MRAAQSTWWVLLVSLCVGCPPPASNKTDKTQPGKTAVAKTPAVKTGDGKAVGGDTDPAPRPKADGKRWPLISPKLAKHPDFYKQLTHLTEWPAPRVLKTIASVPKAERPKEIDSRNLKELVALIVNPRFRPTNLDGAMGVDPQGRLHIKLGSGKPEGSASLQIKPDGSTYPIFCMTFQGTTRGATSIEGLRDRVSEVVVPSLAKALKVKANRIEAWPQLDGNADHEVAGMALLDRQSEHGIQFPYLYGFANKSHLTVLLQEVPHRKMPGQKPR